MSVALADRADTAIWSGSTIGDAEVDEYWRALTHELRAMRRHAGPITRARSAASWQSLKRRGAVG